MRRSNPLKAGPVLLAALAAVSGCGYHFGASGTNLPATARTIYVRPFDNKTPVTGLNDQFMRYLKDEIANHKRLGLVGDPRQADLVLSGSLTGAITLPTAFNSVMEPTVYAESVVIRAALRDTHSNKVIWSTGSLTSTQYDPMVAQSVVTTTPTFLQQNLRAGNIAALPNIQVAETQEHAARNQIMINLAQHLYTAMASGF